MVGRSRGGYALLEILAALAVLGLVAYSAIAVLYAQARGVRFLYEERVAWEAATGEMERLEAGGFAGIRDGRNPLPLRAAGMENLRDANGEISVTSMEQGVLRIAVAVAWTGDDARPHRVEVRTIAGRARP